MCMSIFERKLAPPPPPPPPLTLHFRCNIGLPLIFHASIHLPPGKISVHIAIQFCNIDLQEPHPILLGLDKQWKGSGAKRTYREVREEMIYIPVLDTIQDLLNDDEVLKQVPNRLHFLKV